MKSSGWDAPSFTESLLRLEALAMSGQPVPIEEIAALPDQALEGSPVLLRYTSTALSLSGRYRKAADRIAKAVRRFAAQADHRSMLSMLAQWVLLYQKLDMDEQAGPPVSWLKEEWQRTPSECDGFVPWALARSSACETGDGRTKANREAYFVAALEQFTEAGQWTHAAWIMLDRRFYDPETFHELEPWSRGRQYIARWAAIDSVCRAVNELLTKLEQPALSCLAWEDIPDTIPLRYKLLAMAESLLRLWKSGTDSTVTGTEPGWNRLDQMLSEQEPDPEIMVYAERLRWQWHTICGQPAAAAAALRKAHSLASTNSAPFIKNLLREMEPPKADKLAARPDAIRWHVKLFGQMAVAQDGLKTRPLIWKRQKSKQLFLYLLLHNRYRAPREQLIDELFGDSDPDKLTNQFHVTVHDCRKTLKSIGWDDAIIVKAGTVGIREETVEAVDTERFSTLCRVAEQLWHDEKSEAVRMLEEAVSIYKPLALDIANADWLERKLFQIGVQLSGALRKLSEWALERKRYAEAERLYALWIEWLPEQEEAYQQMIAFLTGRSRHAEAMRWYRRLEEISVNVLGTEPLEETRRLLWKKG